MVGGLRERIRHLRRVWSPGGMSPAASIASPESRPRRHMNAWIAVLAAGTDARAVSPDGRLPHSLAGSPPSAMFDISVPQGPRPAKGAQSPHPSNDAHCGRRRPVPRDACHVAGPDSGRPRSEPAIRDWIESDRRRASDPAGIRRSGRSNSWRSGGVHWHRAGSPRVRSAEPKLDSGWSGNCMRCCAGPDSTPSPSTS